MEVKTNRAIRSLLDRRLVVFTGKGGVGKTTLSAGFALAASRAGKRVLLAEVRSPRRIPPLFGTSPQGDGPQVLSDRTTWINFTPAAALETYALKLLRWRSVYRAVFEQRAVRRFLRAIPSLAEILVLGHLVHLMEGGDFDLAVLDAPSTGPGALMLATPQAVLQGAPPGPLRDGAVWIQKLFSDRRQTAINLVVLLEELPVTEAIGLVHRLRDELRLPLGLVFANRTLADPFSGLAQDSLEAACQAARRTESGRALAAAGGRLHQRLKLQESYFDRLRAGVDLPVVSLPEMIHPSTGPAVVQGLADLLGQGMQERA